MIECHFHPVEGNVVDKMAIAKVDGVKHFERRERTSRRIKNERDFRF